MPRPAKLNAKRAQQICDYVAQGHTREVAAQACGIVSTTLYRWMKRGERQPDGPYGELCRALKARTSRRSWRAYGRSKRQRRMAIGARQPGCSSGATPRSGEGGGLGATRAKLHLLHQVLELDARKTEYRLTKCWRKGCSSCSFLP